MTTQSYQVLDEFVDRLLSEKGLADVQDDVYEQLRQDLLDRVDDRITMTLIENLPQDKLEEAEGMLGKVDAGEMQEFFQKHIADLEQVIAKELVEFKLRYLNP